jgi:hypothetical protein
VDKLRAVSNMAGCTQHTMTEHLVHPDPDVKPPEYRVPRGRSGIGAQSALDTLLRDLERVRQAKQAWGDLPSGYEPLQLRF